MTIKLKDNLLFIDLDYITDIPDKYIRSDISDIESLMRAINDDIHEPDNLFKKTFKYHTFVFQDFFTSCGEITVSNIGLLHELSKYLDVDIEEPVQKLINQYLTHEKFKYPSVSFQNGNFKFENLTSEQENYLDEIDFELYTNWVEIMFVLQSMMIDIDKSVIDESQRNINVETNSRLGKATKNLLVNGGRGLYVTPDTKNVEKIVQNYIDIAKPKRSVIVTKDLSFGFNMDVEPYYGLNSDEDGIYIVNDLYDIKDSPPIDFLVVFDCFVNSQVCKHLIKQTHSVLFVSKYFINMKYHNSMSSVYINNIIWNETQFDICRDLAARNGGPSAFNSYIAPGFYKKILDIYKKELRQARIII